MAAATRKALLFGYWALAAVIVPLVLLALARGSWRGGLVESTFICRGDAPESRRCVFTNAIVDKGVIWLYSRNRDLVVPPMLCSAVSHPDAYRRLCDVRVSTNPVAYRELLGRAKDHHSFDLAVALYRLNPTNAYHSVWEDMLPALGMMRWAGQLPADAKEAMRRLRAARWGLAVVDHLGADLVDKRLWQELLPEVTVAHPNGSPIWAAKLLAGTNTGCAHWGHCAPADRPRGTFDPPDVAMAFREMVFTRFGIREGPAHNGEAVVPCVTIVQRSRTRRLRNLEELVQIVREEMDVEPLVVDMAGMSALEQITVSHNTDIMIMVHGGALMNTIWLPPKALLMDIYPYAFPMGHHSGIVHWMRNALPGVALGHHPFEVLSSQGQELLEGPVKTNCTCRDDGACQATVFIHTAYVHVDAERFREHVRQGLELWREGRYAEPIGPVEFENRMDARVKTAQKLPMCV